MPKRLTYKFIKDQFEKENYKLLTKQYKKAHQKLYYICPKGHIHSIIWNAWQRGHRCPYCAGQGKPTIIYIKFKFEEEKYILLSIEYKNNRQKLEYICPKGHRHSINWSDWCQGYRCPHCVGVGKPTIEFVRVSFKKEDYILLSNKYRNCYQKLNCICSRGHECNISWDRWQQGQRCPICWSINRVGSGHWNWKGGISCEPYCDIWLDKDFKESIKERDNYECQNPDCWHKDGKAAMLTIHHIDYVKKNCRPENLITLCNSCNTRANYNREYWQEFYINIMMKKGLING